jgi:hypothetical protein
MNTTDAGNDGTAALRLRCIEEVIQADDETLTIVHSVLSRVSPTRQPVRKKQRRTDNEGVGPKGDSDGGGK